MNHPHYGIDVVRSDTSLNTCPEGLRLPLELGADQVLDLCTVSLDTLVHQRDLRVTERPLGKEVLIHLDVGFENPAATGALLEAGNTMDGEDFG